MRFTHQTIATLLLSGIFLTGCGTAAREAEYAQVVATITGEQSALKSIEDEIASIETELKTKLEEDQTQLADLRIRVNRAGSLPGFKESQLAELKSGLEEAESVAKETAERLNKQAAEMLAPLREQASKAQDAIRQLEQKRDKLRP